VTTFDSRAPLPVTRRAQLLDALRRDGTVRVSELSDRLGVTPVTVRRDIAELAREGLVRRVHGGATLITNDDDAVDPYGSAENGEMPAAGPIGMLVPSLDYYWPEVARGAEDEASVHNLRVVLRGSSYESDDDRPQLSRLVDRIGVDSLIVAPRIEATTADATLSWLAGTGLPVVLVERSGTVGPHHAVMESVVSDHALGASMAVQHLAGLGHRRIGLVISEQSPTSPHVHRGWVDATRELGAEATLDVAVPSPRSPGWDAALGELLDRCLATGTTALLVHADTEAMALVQRVEERGLSVPGDLSVVAYDDEVAGLFSPPLTAVRPPRRSIGRAAVGLVVARMADPRRPAHRVVISPSLRVRDSTAAPPDRG